MKLFKRFTMLCLVLAMLITPILSMNLEAAAIAGGGLQQSSYRAYGADLSFWNVGGSSLNYSLVDFAKMKADGCQFVILRIGYEGSSSRTNTLDTAFVEFYNRARAAGMPMGIYFYSLATTYNGAVEDANWVANKIEQYGMYFEYPIYYDVEDSAQTALGSSAMESLCLGWCETLESRGYFPAIYGGASQVINKLSSSFKAKYDLWYPRVLTNGHGSQYNPNNYDYSDYCGMWQYAWYDYEYDGIGLDMLDVNVCYKDYPSIMKQYGYNNCGTPESAALTSLRQTIASASAVSHLNYSEAGLEAIRQYIYEANTLINSGSATDSQYTAAENKIKNAVAATPKILSKGKSYTTSAQVRSDAYSDDGIRLTDGSKGCFDGGELSDGVSKGRYAGWQQKAEIVVDLGSVQSSDTYTVYLAAGAWGIHLPKQNYFKVEVQVSNSASSGFTTVGSTNQLKHTGGPNIENEEWTTYTATINASAAKSARYVKFIVTNEECTGHIWLDEVEVALGGTPVINGAYVNGFNEKIGAGDCHIFNISFGTITVDAANHAWTINVIAQWDSSKGAYVVKKVEQGTGSSTADISLVSGQILIAAHAWEGDGVEDPVAGSGVNFSTVARAKVGDIVEFSGLDVNNGYVTAGAYISFHGAATVASDAAEIHNPGEKETCTEDQTCLSCGDVLTPALGHDDGKWVTLPDGSKELQCTICGETIDAEEDFIRGDANGDGQIDMFDYLMIKSIYFEKYVPTEMEAKRSDANGDGNIDMFDYLIVRTAYFTNN